LATPPAQRELVRALPRVQALARATPARAVPARAVPARARARAGPALLPRAPLRPLV
jgi:hypothetical protein